MIAGLTLLSIAFFVATGFAAGYWMMRTSGQYRIGVKVMDGFEKVQAARKFMGPGNVTVADTIRWDYEGYKWKLTIEQFPKDPS